MCKQLLNLLQLDGLDGVCFNPYTTVPSIGAVCTAALVGFILLNRRLCLTPGSQPFVENLSMMLVSLVVSPKSTDECFLVRY